MHSGDVQSAQVWAHHWVGWFLYLRGLSVWVGRKIFDTFLQ